jgi:hypothetical protein
MGDGIALIAAERERQITTEGWTAEHDDAHSDGSLARAAIAYAGAPGRWDPNEAGAADSRTPYGWPWKAHEWRPSGDAVRDLTKAGALIAAEIDRLVREAESTGGQDGE